MKKFAKSKVSKKSPLVKTAIKTPHDLFFKKSLGKSKVALKFIQKHISSPLVKKIDPKSMQLMPGTFIDSFFHESRTDILYKAKALFKGKETILYFLIEHQRKVDSLMPLRIHEYTLRIIRTHLEEHKNDEYPLVFAAVLYNGKKPYSAESSFFKKFNHPKLAQKYF